MQFGNTSNNNFGGQQSFGGQQGGFGGQQSFGGQQGFGGSFDGSGMTKIQSRVCKILYK